MFSREDRAKEKPEMVMRGKRKEKSERGRESEKGPGCAKGLG